MQTSSFPQLTQTLEVHHVREYLKTGVSAMSKKQENSFLILWIFKEKCEVVTQYRKWETEESSIYIFKPGHLLQLNSNGWSEGYVISISADFAHQLQMETLLPFSISKTENSMDEISIYIKFLDEARDILNKMRLLMKEADGQLQLMTYLFRVFLLYIFTHSGTSAQNQWFTREDEITHKFMSLVKSTNTINKRVEDFARELLITRSYMSEMVRKKSGNPPLYHIHKKIVSEAKQLACGTSLSMKEIGYKLGFEDPAHFSKFFKINTGSNFTEFKRSLHPALIHE